jgi:hypothetical protein
MDQDWRYFIASGSLLSNGTPTVWQQWWQIGDDLKADPMRVELSIPQPKATETHFTACSKINQHNRHFQDTLMLERKLVTTDWSRHVNLSMYLIK